MEFTTNRKKSEFSCINNVTARYPYIDSIRKLGSWSKCKKYDLLFAVFRARDEINRFHVPDIDLIAKNVCEDNFRHISAHIRIS